MSNIPKSTKMIIICLAIGVGVVGIITVYNVTTPEFDANVSDGISVLPNSLVAGAVFCIVMLFILELMRRKKEKEGK